MNSAGKASSGMFSVRAGSNTIDLGWQRQGRIVFTVRNISNVTLNRVRFELDASPEVVAEWVQLNDATEKRFAKGVLRQCIVNIQVPAASVAEGGSFTLRVFDVESVEQSLSVSQVVHFDIPKAANLSDPINPPKRSMALVVGGVLFTGLVLAGTAIALLLDILRDWALGRMVT